MLRHLKIIKTSINQDFKTNITKRKSVR